jgi:hypothetical protein
MKKRPQSTHFKKLAEFFRGQGYTLDLKFVVPSKGKGYWYAGINGKSIRGGFCEPNEEDCYWYVRGRIAFDNVKCFDKWSKCPYSLELPKTPEEFQYVVEQMKYLRTKEGFEKSNGYDLWIRDYPFSKQILCSKCNGMKKISGKRTKKVEFKDGNPPMYTSISIKCPKCRGTGKVKRPKGDAV